MKSNKLLMSAALVGLSWYATIAEATTRSPKTVQAPWRCQVQFSAASEGAEVFGFGDYSIEGNGEFDCRHTGLLGAGKPKEVVTVKTEDELIELSDRLEADPSLNVEVKIPVAIRLAGNSMLEVGLGDLQVSGYSQEWSSAKRLENVLGKFAAFKAFGSLGLGFGGFTAVKIARQSVTLQMGLHVISGFGFHYGLSQMEFTLAE